MEGASLDTGARPLGAACLLDSASSVADKDIRRGDPLHEARPVLRVLGSCQVAPDHMVIRAGDEYHASSGEPDAVHVDDMVDLVADGQDRPYLPEPARAARETFWLSPSARIGRAFPEAMI